MEKFQARKKLTRYTLRCAGTTSSVSSPIAPAATRCPLERLQNSLAKRRERTPTSLIQARAFISVTVHRDVDAKRVSVGDAPY